MVESIRISSSIENFKEKLLKRHKDKEEWHWLRHRKSSVTFFGLYHIGDYARFIWHRGPKTIFWCGSDILNIRSLFPFSSYLIPRLLNDESIRHICENAMERTNLAKFDISADVRQAFFDDPDKYQISYKQSDRPNVYLTMHPERKDEYGYQSVLKMAQAFPDIKFHIYGTDGESTKNIIFHGHVPEDQFNEEIKHYQSCLRLNEFDGFGETLAKSALMGQYPMSRIEYPHIIHVPNDGALIWYLHSLKNIYSPNVKASEWWREQLKKDL